MLFLDPPPPNKSPLSDLNLFPCHVRCMTPDCVILFLFPHLQRDPQCFGHTWYLADDMMFFWTVPWLALLYAQGGMRKKLSVLLVLAVVVGCTLNVV